MQLFFSKNLKHVHDLERGGGDHPNVQHFLVDSDLIPACVCIYLLCTSDAAKRRSLPAWIREGLEKVEREKQKKLEQEAREEEERKRQQEEKKAAEEEIKQEVGENGLPIVRKSRFVSVL